LYKCSLNILWCVSVANLSSWRCGGNKLIINSRIENYQNHKNPSQILQEKGKKRLKKWRFG